jgi:patatin-like phospholipase/acyl hydrolase
MFRILCLDGGGIKGAFTASVLTAIEAETGARIGEYFDLVAGTSTGGILALGVGLRLPAADIMNFYRSMGPDIFPSMGLLGIRGIIRQMIGPKYDSAKLRAALGEVLGEKKLGESQNRLIVPTYDSIGSRIFLLKTAHHERFKYDYKARAVDVALATSAAPTYFESAPFPEHDGARFVDGGVWANNPVLAAIVEAHRFLEIPLDEMEVLSIGTTFSPFSIAKNRNAGVLKWNVGMINLMFEAQAEAAQAQAGLLLKNSVLRINVSTLPGEYSLGDAAPEKIERLIQLGRAEAVKKAVLEPLKARFIDPGKAAPFVPVHKLA